MDSTTQALATVSPHFYCLEVPWLGGTHDGFPLLPIQHYIKERRSKHPLFPPTASQIQSLLIFGVLEAAIGSKISENQLLQSDGDTGTVVAQGGMSALLEDWRQRTLQIQSWEEALHWVSGVRKAVGGGSTMFEMAITNKAFHRLPEVADPLVIAQLYAQAASVLEAVYTTSAFIIAKWSPQWQLPIIPGPRFGAYISSLQPMIDQMVADGWCPFTLSILSEHPSILSYAFAHPPHHSPGAREHRACSRTHCAANNIDTSNYKPAHVAPDCSCAFLKPSLDAVLDALTKDTIPVVQLSPDGESIVTSTSSQTPFVALSHVWADGLGSTTEAGLPRCQLQRIATLVQPLNPGGAFWMDSLCVPAVREQRKKAIALMAQTYRDASHVLVLDAAIRRVPRTAGCVEKLFRIATSGWMQRLWTLQEGVLARRLLFEFSGGSPVDLEKLVEPAEATGECLANAVFAYLTHKVVRLRHYRSRAAQPHTSFTLTDVFLSLRWRATSRPSDETLAIAGLLNVDAGELVNLAHEDRLPHLFLKLGTVDDSLPFSRTPRLAAPGFRWAPSTMMCHVPAKISGVGRPRAVCTRDGLRATYFAVLFDEVELAVGSSVVSPFVCVRDAASQEDYIAVLSDTDASEERTWLCNMLLFVHDSLGGHTTSSVAAFRYGVDEEDGGPRHLCTYQTHLMVKDVRSQFRGQSLPPEIPIVEGILERVNVRLD